MAEETFPDKFFSYEDQLNDIVKEIIRSDDNVKKLSLSGEEKHTWLKDILVRGAEAWQSWNSSQSTTRFCYPCGRYKIFYDDRCSVCQNFRKSSSANQSSDEGSSSGEEMNLATRIKRLKANKRKLASHSSGKRSIISPMSSSGSSSSDTGPS